LEQETTDQSFILIGPDGKSTILVYRGRTRLEKKLIDFSKLKARWFCVSNLEGNLELLEALIKFAKENQIKIAVNPGRLEIEQKATLLPLVREIDILVINKEEAAQLTDSQLFDPKLFSRAALVSQGLVAITQGAEGVFLYDQKDRLLESDGFKLETVDSTGAGDGFFCGLVAGLIRDWDLKKALKLGVCNGASVVTKIGAKAALLQEKHIHNWLEKPLKMVWRE
jgi:ribokinase